MINVNGFEHEPPINTPLAVIFTDKEFLKTVKTEPCCGFLCLDDNTSCYLDVQVIGWVLFDDLTTKQKGYLGGQLNKAHWCLSDKAAEYTSIKLNQSDSVPPNNTRASVLTSNGLFVETMCRSDGFVPVSDGSGVGRKGYFDSSEIIGWVWQRDLTSSQRALIGQTLSPALWQIK
jgi:hypothetical protein